jgi:hypothetical protein
MMMAVGNGDVFVRHRSAPPRLLPFHVTPQGTSQAPHSGTAASISCCGGRDSGKIRFPARRRNLPATADMPAVRILRLRSFEAR